MSELVERERLMSDNMNCEFVEKKGHNFEINVQEMEKGHSNR
jgi:hypothetical protein